MIQNLQPAWNWESHREKSIWYVQNVLNTYIRLLIDASSCRHLLEFYEAAARPIVLFVVELVFRDKYVDNGLHAFFNSTFRGFQSWKVGKNQLCLSCSATSYGRNVRISDISGKHASASTRPEDCFQGMHVLFLTLYLVSSIFNSARSS